MFKLDSLNVTASLKSGQNYLNYYLSNDHDDEDDGDDERGYYMHKCSAHSIREWSV